ncbi:hypothetical protein HPB47_020845 [Ixodes persulcatus]|uniref:Uncharacterized protein n=1 Tax=Ixodes persulcatus TaxID=34615 RepID=A0AC60QHS8_IXOPE|nr:hypothetical protein HPB47_020845 [Ixodes persulcatus]
MVVSVQNYYKTIPACGQCGAVGNRVDACPNLQPNTCGLCGLQPPLVEWVRAPHNCVAQCSVCGGAHATNSRDCAAKFRTPKMAAKTGGKKNMSPKKKSLQLGPPGDQSRNTTKPALPTGGAGKRPSTESPPHSGLEKRAAEMRGKTGSWSTPSKTEISAAAAFEARFEARFSAINARFTAFENRIPMIVNAISKLQETIPAMIAQQIAHSLRGPYRDVSGRTFKPSRRTPECWLRSSVTTIPPYPNSPWRAALRSGAPQETIRPPPSKMSSGIAGASAPAQSGRISDFFFQLSTRFRRWLLSRSQGASPLVQTTSPSSRTPLPADSLVIVGDFNAPSTLWGYVREEKRGRKLVELASTLGLTLHTDPAYPTRVENHLLHLWEARHSLVCRWRRQKHNRKNKSRIAELTQRTAKYAAHLADWNWVDRCNTAARKISSRSPKMCKPALDLPMNTYNQRLMGLGMVNTFAELQEAHLTNQYTRLSKTSSGHHLLTQLHIHYLELTEERVRIPEVWRYALHVRPLPVNMTRDDHSGRHLARAAALAGHYGSKPGIFYVDTSGPHHRECYTAAVVHQNVLVNGPTFRAQDVTHAEEIAIALAAAYKDSRIINTDSRGACRIIEQGYIPSLKIATSSGPSRLERSSGLLLTWASKATKRQMPPPARSLSGERLQTLPKWFPNPIRPSLFEKLLNYTNWATQFILSPVRALQRRRNAHSSVFTPKPCSPNLVPKPNPTREDWEAALLYCSDLASQKGLVDRARAAAVANGLLY